MDKIEKFTQEQKDLIPEVRNEWIKEMEKSNKIVSPKFSIRLLIDGKWYEFFDLIKESTGYEAQEIKADIFIDGIHNGEFDVVKS